jgi:hypothetical protein
MSKPKRSDKDGNKGRKEVEVTEVIVTEKISERRKDRDHDCDKHHPHHGCGCHCDHCHHGKHCGSKGCGKTGGSKGSGGTYTGPTATPYLLIPSSPADNGTRPITPVAAAVMNNSIQAVITNPTVASGWAGYEVQLTCIVGDLGVMRCAAGIAEFYVGGQFSVSNAGHEGLTPAQVKANAQLVGYAGFQVPPGGAAVVACQKLWTPGSSSAAKKGVLVQAYDFFTDPMTAPFDAIDDRHVARNDQVSFIVSAGTVTLKGTFLFDLDAGVEPLQPGVDLAPTDIWWNRITVAGEAQMTPQNGASIINLGVVDFSSLIAANLQGLAFTSTPINGSNDATNQLVVGDVFAVKTNSGNLAKVLVLSYGYDIVIQWVTYLPPL